MKTQQEEQKEELKATKETKLCLEVNLQVTLAQFEGNLAGL